MASSEEFDGDEFSNNLFSDLAPLITLFGEQVTMQFLSMSLGWADNFLLAMGPLGIITTVTSAIRIGGSKGLKALIGRARETQPVAEQELLSSTSASVCELWNGQQVTRLIGEPKGMITVVISPDGRIRTLREAFQERIIVTKENSDKTTAIDSQQKFDAVADYFGIEDHISLLDLSLPPNLSLNSYGGPASQSTLWRWAGVGVVLQTFAIVFPGMATYYLKWSKGGNSVASYGYPCFVVGSVGLTLGMMLCGHIIEGATRETDFVLSENNEQGKPKILCLQKEFTIGDQKFPSCAIFLAGDGTLRTSRRSYPKHNYAWSRAAASTFITIAGYIIQFVGLRALHWSATVVQLAVTIIMTCIRAFARRRLASDLEISHYSFAGHEIACLALRLKFESLREKPPGIGSYLPKLLRRLTGALSDLNLMLGYLSPPILDDLVQTFNVLMGRKFENEFENSQFFWELVSGHSEESSVIDEWLKTRDISASSDNMRDTTGYVSSQLLQWPKGPLKADIEFRSAEPIRLAESNSEGTVDLLQSYTQIASGIRNFDVTATDDDSVRASERLVKVIEEVMDLLSTKNGLTWKQQTESLFSVRDEALQACWSFNIREGRVSRYHEMENVETHFKVNLRREIRSSRSNLWRLDHSSRNQLQAAISLSLCSNAARLMYAAGTADEAIPMMQQHTTKGFLRIVGYSRRCEVEDSLSQIQRWLGTRVVSSTLAELQKVDQKKRLQGLVGLVLLVRNLSALKRRLKISVMELMTANSEQTAESLGINMTTFTKLGEDPEQLARVLRRGVHASYLGIFLSSSATSPQDSHQDEFEELYIEQPCQGTIAIQYAQELFSLFMLAIASKVDSVNGVTRELRHSDGTDDPLLENTTFRAIAEIAVQERLVPSLDEAYTLIIPAFAKYNLLPDRLHSHFGQPNEVP